MLCIIKLCVWPWGKKKLNDGWQQQCFEVPFSLPSLCCSIIKKQKEKDFNWINTHSMGHLLCLLFQHLGIAGKLSFIVAAEGFQGSKERREEGLSYHSSGGGAQAHLWPTQEELPQFLAGSSNLALSCAPCLALAFSHSKNVVMKASGKIKILTMCKGQNTGEVSTKTFSRCMFWHQ